MNSKVLALLLLALFAMHDTQAAKVYKVTWKFSVKPTVLNVKCGDVIWLQWPVGYHNVYKSSKGLCTGPTVKLLKPATGNGSYKYKVSSKDKRFWFVCTVGQHCQQFGMKLAIRSTCPPATGRKLAELA